MGDLHVGKIQGKWNLLPIRTVYVYASGTVTSFNNLGSESSFKYTALTRKDGKGGNRQMGFNVEITIYVGHNNYNEVDPTAGETMVQRIEYLSKNKHDVQLFLGDQSKLLIPAEHRAEIVNTTGGYWLECNQLLRLTYDMEYVEYGPRIILKYTGYLPKIF